MEKIIPHFIGIGNLQKRPGYFIKKLDSVEESFVVSHSEPRAILMSLKRYEFLRSLEEREFSRQREIDDVLRIIQEGNDEYTKGRTIKAKSMRELADK